jgi:diguanylate cyclase (GGDEF)-like protein
LTEDAPPSPPASFPEAGDGSAEDHQRLRRQVERERRARQEAERIAAQGLRDLYDRQQEVMLLEAIASAGNHDLPTAELLDIALRRVCEYAGWPLGHAWLVSGTGTELRMRSAGVWYMQGGNLAQRLIALSGEMELRSGEGLPGRIHQAAWPIWLTDLACQHSSCPRREAALEAGLRLGCGFPVLVGEEVVAVLEFFSAEPAPADDSVMRLMLQIGTQLGQVVERRRLADSLVQAKLRLDAALDNMSQGLCMFGPDQRLVLSNARYAQIYRLEPGQVRPGTPFTEMLAQMDCMDASAEAASLRERLLIASASREPFSVVEELRDGRSIAISYSPMPDGGWVATHEDVTDRRRTEARIAHMAHHDPLTDLPNRVLFRDRLGRGLAHLRRDGGQLAVLCLDLDRFKVVNDTLGHPTGDVLLQAVTARLQRCLRDADTVARLGGDEFAVIQTGPRQPRDATSLAQRLIAELALPFDLEGQQVVIGASVGIALAPEDGEDPDTLLKNADLALYRAKAEGRGTYRFFEADMNARVQARRALELDLRRALSANEFELFYQPVVALKTRRLRGFEALLRWRHPTRGLVSPGEFIPLAEEIGLVIPLGDWVLRRACAEAAGWPAALKVAVNLSPAQFAGHGPLASVTAALSASGLDPARLEIEITETVMLADTQATLRTLRELKQLGVSIVMDDFGTGYSSLSHLRKFPFDRVKIDRSFIAGLGQREDSVAIVRAVAALCEALGMATTAEGVETEDQLRSLATLCTDVQGYLFSPPRPASEIPQMIDRLERLAQPA